jgi:membrane associated rhomboid family serine protease
MFVSVEQRHRQHLPWATIAIISICVGVFLWLASVPIDEHIQLLRRWGTVPATLFDSNALLAPQWPALRAARLVTALFIHIDWLHLTGNLLFLMIFGVSAERALGAGRFLTLFLLGGALANLVGDFALFPRARLGLVLPLGLFLEFVRIPAPALIGFWILLQLLFTFVGPAFGAVVWWTHIAGFAIGILFALISRPAIARRLRR